MLFKDTAPFIEMSDEAGNTIFASQYIFYEGFQLDDGCFIAIPSILSYKPEQPPPPVTWLYLEPSTSQLVIHTSRLPDQIDKASEIWRSENFKMPEKGDEESSRFVLQGYGISLALDIQLMSTAAMATWSSIEEHQCGLARLEEVFVSSSMELTNMGAHAWS